MTTNPTLNQLPPWTIRPFELLYHAEIHFQKGSDYDKRLSIISFDNSIEVSITTYLSLKPMQRAHKQYKKEDVEKWMSNYHTKIDFFIEENKNRGLPEHYAKQDIIWYHDQRNEQYHGSTSSIPTTDTLTNIRQIAIWIFSVLFQIPDVEGLFKYAINESEKSFPEIPTELVIPKISSIQQIHENSLFIASILGGWDENSQGDNEIIREVTDGF
jgi:hypothetical protein